ncbi:hypothetical protein PhCBS80983_g03557 [Powellomyces hirtus]|uniref:U2A'/phosphoprotein 32 family A C-terminal domain-containing protein n=1 Tax=Powellomyces hirtus TaxID=109895 RepID=A0A507E205_9FUNG|nr:hypothetical protein PhCBS80983_g03557 [Powellomyces hirtus]
MPASAHSNAPVINPEISTPQDDVEDLINGFLSSEKLIALTGAQDLNNVHFLEMKVDIRRTSLGSLGKLLPELQHIKLNNSYIPSIRDIGSGFMNLTVLWMARCDLSDLDGIASMFSLEEVYLAHNEISDLSSLGMLEALQVLDLEGNAVEDLEQIEYLGLCSMLRQLTISNNPLRLDSEDDGGEDEQPPKLRRKQARYGAEIRHRICTSLPQIAILDDVPVTARDRLPLSETLRVEPEKCAPSTPLPPSAGRPSSSSCTPRRPRTAGGGGGRFSTPSRYAPSNEDASSGLTHGSGQIMAGNPILFLRTRRASNRSRANTPPSESLVHTDKDAPPTPVIMKPSLPHPQTATPPPHTSSFASNPPALLNSSVSTAPSTSPAPMLIQTSFAPRPPSATRPATADPHSSPSYPSHPQLPASVRSRRLRSISSTDPQRAPGRYAAHPPPPRSSPAPTANCAPAHDEFLHRSASLPSSAAPASPAADASPTQPPAVPGKDVAFYARVSTDLMWTRRRYAPKQQLESRAETTIK